jgi:hypothetical protein
MTTKMNTFFIYEIYCLDENISDNYIYYTTNLKQRKYYHKQQLGNSNEPLYKKIRENGGFDNWDIRILDTVISTASDAANKLMEYNYSIPHNIETTFLCEPCNYECSRKYDYNKHCNTSRHMKTVQQHNTSLGLLMKDMIISNQMIQQQLGEICKQQSQITRPDDVSTQLLSELVKSNQAMQQQITELSTKQPIQQITNVVQQNTQNNSFNIQVFLNETCGEAFNLSDILKSMVITNEDLVYNTQVGFVKGMTAIFKREMCDKIPLVKRPLHCTDLKRETVFYRENNVWHKEEGKTVEEDIMFQLTRSCLRTYLEWRKVHPDAENMRSEFNTLCDKIQVSVMPGYEKDKLYPKTMTEIYKHCLIDKKNMR